MKNKTILDYVADYQQNLSPVDAYNQIVKKIKTLDLYNCCLKILDLQTTNNQSKSLLKNIPYSLKDNIATKGVITTGGSLFLKNFVPPYNAYVKDLLDGAGAICISKDNLDEFGLGGTGTFSAFGVVKNAYDDRRIAGGSSSGSAIMISKGVVPFAICTDTGDSIRKPASFQGIVGFKPSYGAISRYGVYPYAPSIDHVGILANCVEDIAIVFSVICKKDIKDLTSIDLSSDYYHNLQPHQGAKLALLKDALEFMSKPELELFNKYLDELKQNNFIIEPIDFSLNLLELIDPIYRALSYSEATSCYANFSGILFGNKEKGNNFNEILTHTRTKNFGQQLKRRFVIGAYITSSENFELLFTKSKKIRTLIIDRCKEIFKSYDGYILPGSSTVAPLISDVENHKPVTNICDDALQIANFAGLPSITIPAIEYQGLPIGINITCNYKNDQKVLNIAQAIATKGR